MKTITLINLALGCLILLFSLRPAWLIWKESDNRQALLGWSLLLVLIVFFLAGYVTSMGFVVTQVVNWQWAAVSTLLLAGAAFVLIVVRMSTRSIYDARSLAAQERVRALHDDLTGLGNRGLLRERIDRCIRQAARDDAAAAVLVMDLDRFKEVNDTLGHQCGDVLLSLVAERLRSSVRQDDTVARLGGDEFAMVLPAAGMREAVRVCSKIAQLMEEPFEVENYTLSVGISIGIAVYPAHGDTVDTLLRHADVAMYVAKRNEHDYAIYDAAQDHYTVARLNHISRLRQDIRNDKLELYYQPKVDLRRQTVCGVEALVRWPDGLRAQHMAPEEMVGLSEQSGLIEPLTGWVLDAALAQQAAWMSHGIRLPVAINLSIRSIHDARFPGRLAALTSQYNVPPEMVTLEITESSMMQEPRRAGEVLQALDSLGFELSIDDFGTGYSSLAYLKRLPAREIKIDRGFVMDMMDSDHDAIIVRSIIDLAHNMSRSVTAEGVASKDILEIVQILGCDRVQGYYICPPLPARELLDWLGDSQWYRVAGMA